MTWSYNLEQVVIIKSGCVLNCMISDKMPFCHITMAGQYPDKLLQVLYIFAHVQSGMTICCKSDRSSDQACQPLGNQSPSIGILNACMCLRNKYYGVAQLCLRAKLFPTFATPKSDSTLILHSNTPRHRMHSAQKCRWNLIWVYKVCPELSVRKLLIIAALCCDDTDSTGTPNNNTFYLAVNGSLS